MGEFLERHLQLPADQQSTVTTHLEQTAKTQINEKEDNYRGRRGRGTG